MKGERIINYWIFQYTTKVYPNIITDLDSGVCKKWEVNKCIKRIKKGDKALIYIGGVQQVYGIVDVTTDPYYLPEKGKYYCGIQVNTKLDNESLGYHYVKKEIPTLKVGISGTNFTVSPQEIESVLTLN